MVSIAIPSSVISASTAYSLEQATFTLYQISRACVHFGINEIVIYESIDNDTTPEEEAAAAAAADKPKKIRLDEEVAAIEKPSHSQSSQVDNTLIFTANMLQYLITPAYLRMLIFKPFGKMREFKHAKNLPQIPELLLHDNKKIMLGIAVPKERKKRLPGQKKLTKKDRRDATLTPYINLGFDRLFKLKNNAAVQTHSQVYVDLSTGEPTKAPPANHGSTYSVRAVKRFSQIFTQSPFAEGYSQTIYIPTQQFKSKTAAAPLIQSTDFASLSKGQNDNLLLLFGAWSEVQYAVRKDSELDLPDASALFDGISLGTERTRLEDAVTITLSKLLN